MKRQGGVTNKQGGQNRKRMTVNLRHIATPDAEQRLSRAMSILLKAATKHTATLGGGVNAKKQQPPCPAPAEDAPTGQGEAVPDE